MRWKFIPFAVVFLHCEIVTDILLRGNVKFMEFNKF